MTKVFFENDHKQVSFTSKPGRKTHCDDALVAYGWNQVLEEKPILSMDADRGDSPLGEQNEVSKSKKPRTPFELVSKVQKTPPQNISPQKTQTQNALLQETPLKNIPQDLKKTISFNQFDDLGCLVASSEEDPSLDFFKTDDENKNILAAVPSTSIAAAFSPFEISLEPSLEIKTDLGVGPMISQEAISQIEEIIYLLADEITISLDEGITETSIPIKNNVLFNQAILTITESDTAYREINISFKNLSQQAHEIICMQANQDLLKHALEQKGYYIHIITAHTELLQEPNFEGYQDSNHRENHQEHRHHGGRQHQRQKER